MHKSLVAGVVLALLAGLPSLAHAEPREMDLGQPDQLSGTPYNLPIGPDVPESHATAWASGMPAVRAVIDYFRSLGYVARPEYDRAANQAVPPATLVFLAFEKPGYVAPAGHVAAPVIAVHSLLTDAGVARTTISGAFADLDMSTAVITVIDPDGAGSEVDVPPPDIDSVSSPGDLEPAWFGASNSAADKKFRKFAGCTALSAASGLVAAATMPPPIPQKIVVQAAVTTAIGIAGCAFSAW